MTIFLFVFRFSFLTFHFRKTHYVAIVPADLRSAGIEYKKRSSAQLIS